MVVETVHRGGKKTIAEGKFSGVTCVNSAVTHSTLQVDNKDISYKEIVALSMYTSLQSGDR